jgi:hypothetical protein
VMEGPRTVEELRRLRELAGAPTSASSAPTSAPSAPTSRPRERRDGSRRHLTRGGPDENEDSDGPPGATRACACGCVRDISSRRSDALTYDASCRK